jgi:predicted TPR repeat methyltransferase
MIDQYASFLLHQMGDENGAIALYLLNTNNYARSAHAHERMGDSYVATGRSANAVESYRRALSLEPDNDRLAEKAQAPIEP